ncbi:MAG: bifunctional metallophosphatase/5'-nucleotidase [Campylobacterales bacterium]|nr:bifunctional metallophosphatase/5'-nucleotidase [Campylobacterales bacterium]
MSHAFRLSLAATALLSASFIFVGCNEDADDTKAKTLNLRIAETTDMHGQIFPYDFIEAKEDNRSLAHVSSYVKEQRTLDKADHLLEFMIVDNGDLLQGQPIVNVYNNKDLTKTNHIYADTMNFVGYELGVIGNHDVEPGHAVFDNMVKQLNFPWLAANAIKEGSSHDPYFKAYHSVVKQGVKITFLGLTTPGVPNWLAPELWSGIVYEDMIESARYWVEKIQTEEKPDVLIGVFHAGLDYTYGGGSADSENNENAVRLVAKALPGAFDAIFYGHDHKPSEEHNDSTVYLGGGSYASIVSVADINLTWSDATKSYDKTVTPYRVDMKKYVADAEFMSTFQSAFDETKTFVSQPVATLSGSMTSQDAMFKDAPFNDIIHELEFYVAKEVLATPIDISIAAPLQFDVTLSAGEVKFSDMWKLYKYDNTYYVMELSGSEIKNYLEYNYDLWMNTMSSENDHLINFKKDANGTIILGSSGTATTSTAYYNYDSMAGIVYTVDVSKPKGSKITILGMDANLDGAVDAGSSFDMAHTYRVGINSYRGGGGGGHLTTGAGIAKEQLTSRMVTKTETGLREYLINWMGGQGTYTPRAIGGWKVIPEAYATAGEAKSRELLYQSGSH